MRLILPYPVSTNRIWRVAKGRVTKSDEAKKFSADVKYLALEAGIKETIKGPVKVVMHYHPRKGKKSFDLDNVTKASLDALQGIAYDNDNQIVFLSINKSEPTENGGLVVDWEAA